MESCLAQVLQKDVGRELIDCFSDKQGDTFWAVAARGNEGKLSSFPT